MENVGDLRRIARSVQIQARAMAGMTTFIRYVNWNHASINPESVENFYANPGMVKSIYVWQTAGRAIPRAASTRSGCAARIEPSSVPEDLQPLLAAASKSSSHLSDYMLGKSAGSSPDELSRNNEANQPWFHSEPI